MSRLLPLLVLAGCVINSNSSPRPRDLTPGWKVDKLRLLAIQAEPPELAPGEQATLTALWVGREGPLGTVFWTACGPDEATDFGCPLDPAALSPDATLDELLAAGVIGIEPGLPPVLLADEADLDGLDERQRQEGVNLTVTAFAVPADASQAGDFDFNSIEAGFKRVVVSEAATPNHNPVLERLTVDGVEVTPETTVVVDAGQAYDLGAVLGADTLEAYDYLNLDGVVEARVEAPYAQWYASGGSVEEDITLHPFLESTWVAPQTSGERGHWYMVLRDRRGGLAWLSQPWRTR